MKIVRFFFVIIYACISFHGFTQNPQKASLRTDTSVIIPGTAGNNALIRRADTSNAGVMSAADKKKLDRVEFVSSFTELRAVTNVNTFTSYRLMYNQTVCDFFYDPSDVSSTDDTAMVLITAGGKRLKRFVQNWIDARWFGANPAADGVDDYPYLQKAINWCIKNRSHGTLYITAGEYLLSNGLLVRKDLDSDGKTEFVSLDIVGDKISGNDDNTNGGESLLVCNYKTDFGIGIQKGKTMRISNIALRGLNVEGYKVNELNVGDASHTWLTEGIRNNRFSPNAAIVIDPIGTSAVLPNNRYPNRINLYTEASNAGSTAIAIENCFIRGFAVGICNSPNGTTLNAECHNFEHIWISNCKSAIANCNQQSRTVYCRDIKTWGGVECVFDHQRYGDGTSSAMLVEDVNIAGACKYIVATNNWGIGYYHQFNKLHAESTWAIGGDILKGTQIGNIVFKNCQIDLTGENSGNQKRATIIAWCSTLDLQDSYIGYYSASDPSIMFCNAAMVIQRNCAGNTIATLNPYETSVFTQFSVINGDRPYYVMDNANGLSNNIQLFPGLEIYKNGYLSSTATGLQLRQKYCGKALNTYGLTGTYSPFGIDAGKRTAAFRVGTQVYKCAPGALVASTIADDFGNPVSFCVGVITAVDPGSQTIVIGKLSSKVTSSFNNALYLMQVAQLHTRPAFYIGDITASSPTITNIEGDFGSPHSMQAGQYFNHPAFIPGTYIKGVAANTITLSTGALYSETGAFVLNETNWESVGLNGETQATFNSFYNQTAFKEGDMIRVGYANNTRSLDTNKLGFVCVKAGMFNTTRPPKFKPVYANPSTNKTREVTSITTNTTLNNTHDIVKVSAAGGNVTVTLPAASVYPGIAYTIKRTDNSKNICTVSGKMDGAASYHLTAQYKYVTVISNGTDWDIIGNN